MKGRGSDRRGEQPVVPKAEVRTYYDRPILKRPPWKWMIPAYFFTGGVAAVSSLLAMGGRVTGNGRLARQSRLAALGSVGVSTALLVMDLGRPARLFNMLRVFKPTSPMSVGSWLLSGYGMAAGRGFAACSCYSLDPWNLTGGATRWPSPRCVGAALLRR